MMCIWLPYGWMAAWWLADVICVLTMSRKAKCIFWGLELSLGSVAPPELPTKECDFAPNLAPRWLHFACSLAGLCKSTLAVYQLSLRPALVVMGAQLPTDTIPWRLLLSKAPVWALIVCHFCHNWGTFILLTWMPTYYNQARLLQPPSPSLSDC